MRFIYPVIVKGVHYCSISFDCWPDDYDRDDNPQPGTDAAIAISAIIDAVQRNKNVKWADLFKVEPDCSYFKPTKSAQKAFDKLQGLILNTFQKIADDDVRADVRNINLIHWSIKE